MVGSFGCACVGNEASNECGAAAAGADFLQPASRVAANSKMNNLVSLIPTVCRSRWMFSTQLNSLRCLRRSIRIQKARSIRPGLWSETNFELRQFVRRRGDGAERAGRVGADE